MLYTDWNSPDKDARAEAAGPDDSAAEPSAGPFGQAVPSNPVGTQHPAV